LEFKVGRSKEVRRPKQSNNFCGCEEKAGFVEKRQKTHGNTPKIMKNSPKACEKQTAFDTKIHRVDPRYGEILALESGFSGSNSR
jgi:hypothetical protein